MKTLISVFLALCIVSVSYAQMPDVKYTAVDLSDGLTMSAIACAAAMDDTTQAFRVGGFAKVYIHLITATNDSASVLLSYQVSNDGATWSGFTVFDSLSVTGTVGANKAFELPAGGMGGEYVRIRIDGSDSGRNSSNPSTTVKVVIRKKYY